MEASLEEVSREELKQAEVSISRGWEYSGKLLLSVLSRLCLLPSDHLWNLVGRSKWKLPERTWTKPRKRCSAYPKRKRRGQGLGMRFPAGLVEAVTDVVRRPRPPKDQGLASVNVFVEPGLRLRGQTTLLSHLPIMPTAPPCPLAAALLGNEFPDQHLDLDPLQLQLLLQFLPQLLSLLQFPFLPPIR